jgi:hypothetical protein
LEDSLKLERYKYVLDRQKYFTDLARDAFASYARFFTGLVAGGFVLVSTRNRLELRPDVLAYLVHGIVYVLAFLGFVASAQIAFCLARWRGFREAEMKINVSTPPLRWWWWVFETLYILAIWFTIVAAWYAASAMPNMLAKPVP